MSANAERAAKLARDVVSRWIARQEYSRATDAIEKALDEVGAAEFARGREELKGFAALMATACWSSKRHRAIGMGGEAIHFRAVEAACKALGIEFRPRDADISAARNAAGGGA